MQRQRENYSINFHQSRNKLITQAILDVLRLQHTMFRKVSEAAGQALIEGKQGYRPNKSQGDRSRRPRPGQVPTRFVFILISLTVLEVTYIIMPSCETVFASRWHRSFNDHITTARIKVTLNVTFLLELAIPACIVATTQRGPRATTPRQYCQQRQQ